MTQRSVDAKRISCVHIMLQQRGYLIIPERTIGEVPLLRPNVRLTHTTQHRRHFALNEMPLWSQIRFEVAF